MLNPSDRTRARYLLQARSDGKYKLRYFVAFNKWRHLAFGLYVLLGGIYFLRWGTWLGFSFFIGLCAGALITELSWLRGRNRSWAFTSKTTNWHEITRLAETN